MKENTDRPSSRSWSVDGYCIYGGGTRVKVKKYMTSTTLICIYSPRSICSALSDDTVRLEGFETICPGPQETGNPLVLTASAIRSNRPPPGCPADHHGHVISARARWIGRVGDALTTEALAARFGMEVAGRRS
jgi:hypothetical protein